MMGFDCFREASIEKVIRARLKSDSTKENAISKAFGTKSINEHESL